MTLTAIVFWLLLLAGVPIALVLVAAGLAGAWSIGGIAMFGVLADRMLAGVSSFVLIAIPYFIFTTEIMNRAGITERLIGFNNRLLGHVRGALSHVNITVSLFFAGLTGAAVTDTVAIGKALIPAMKREGYDADYSAAVTACSSIIGPIIPPSIIMVVYASTIQDVSVLALFAGGIVPGLAMAGALLAASAFVSWRRGYPRHGRATAAEILRTGLAALPAMITPIIILGGILSGAATVTEAAALGAIYTLLLALVGHRSLGARDLWAALVATVRFSGVIFFLLAGSTLLGWYVTRSGLAREAAEVIALVSDSPYVQILVVNVFLLALGMFLDVLPAMIVSAPVLAPAMASLGFDPLHVAIVMLLALNLGNVTPPVGMTLMTAAQIAEVPYERAIKESLPFIVSHLVVIALASAFPAFVLWFPRLIGAVR
jgi:tripartite ATP-independent transporter DctM subunit